MLNNNTKTSLNDNIFDKKKLVEEAKRDNENIKNAQKQREKNVLILKVSNLKQDITRLRMEMRSKEIRLNDFKKSIILSKQIVSELGFKIKKEEGDLNFLKFGLESQNTKASSLKSELDKLKINADSLKKEIQKIEIELQNKKTELSSIDQRTRFLETEMKKIPKNEDKKVDIKKGEKEKIEAELVFKKRQISDFEREEKNVSEEINKLGSSISQKELEVNSLMIKISQIK
ncbi:MAG: hypothetical protein WCC74_01300 [Minisyncoccia bacterium]